MPFPYKGGFHVSAGSKSNLAINRVYYNSVSTYKNPCRSDLTVLPGDSIYFKYTSMLKNYSHSTCRDIYIQSEIIIKECDCLDPELTSTYDIVDILKKAICTSAVQQKCIDDQEFKVFNVDVSHDDCPIECSSEQFHAKIDTTSYPTESYLRLLETDGIEAAIGTNIDKIKDSLVSVSIYYQDPWYTVVDTKLVMTSDTYIALIGNF